MLRYLTSICPRNNRAQKDFEASGCFAEVYRMLKCLCMYVYAHGLIESHRTDILPCKKSQKRSKAMKTSKCYQKFCYIFVVPLESPSQHLLLSPRPWLPQHALFCQPGSPQRSPSLRVEHAMEVTSSLLANLSICCHSRGIGKALLRCHTACCCKFLPSAASAFTPILCKSIKDSKWKAIPLSYV